MSDKDIMPSREVCEWAVHEAERLQGEGKATSADVMVAWLWLWRRTLRDHKGPLSPPERKALRRLVKVVVGKAREAGIDLEGHQ
jgi:hypothetical protein